MDRWEKKLEKEGLGNLKDEELEQLARAKIMEQKVELEKVKKARLERERERQERLELEELEQRYLQQFRLQIIVLVRNGLSNVADSCSLHESGSKFFLMYRIAARFFTKSESKFKAFSITQDCDIILLSEAQKCYAVFLSIIILNFQKP